MWKPSKEDCLFLISSVFVGISNNHIKYYIYFESPENNVINMNYMKQLGNCIELGTFDMITYYPDHNNLHMKQLLKKIEEFEEEYQCEVYYYPYSLKEGQKIFDIVNDIRYNYEKNGLE